MNPHAALLFLRPPKVQNRTHYQQTCCTSNADPHDSSDTLRLLVTLPRILKRGHYTNKIACEDQFCNRKVKQVEEMVSFDGPCET